MSCDESKTTTSRSSSPLEGRARTLALALIFDWTIGEPPAMLHPVVWIGKLIDVLDRAAPRAAPRRELLYGAGAAVVAVTTAVVPTLAIARAARNPDRRIRMLAHWLEIWLLKSAFSWRTLTRAGEHVRQPLCVGDIDAARAGLRWLVSRDAAMLDATLIAAAAIESLAENASDSVVAPLFFYALFGLPGVWAYRTINTLDAMLGYRGRYEHLGKVSARLDDALNLAPARLTALLITVAAAGCGGARRQAWRVMLRDYARTASPNAGWPMAAIAGALGVCLEKLGHYRINSAGRPPTAADIQRGACIVNRAIGLAFGLALAWLVVKERGKHQLHA